MSVILRSILSAYSPVPQSRAPRYKASYGATWVPALPYCERAVPSLFTAAYVEKGQPAAWWQRSGSGGG